MSAAPATVVLLGSQRFDPGLSPSLDAAAAGLGFDGTVATITAGWQERESEDEELTAHLGGKTVNLNLHARGEELFREDPELRDAHRERQDSLRHRQDFYRIRLEHELAARLVIEKRVAPADILEEELEASFAAVRELDAKHIATCGRLHAAFETRWSLNERPSVARHRKAIVELVGRCSAVAISGGHVATLINRLALFGIAPLLANKIVFAWSGGAMAISDRVVLFHDDPPQGPGVSEILDAGLGLVPGVLVLPQPEQRLQLDRPDRVRRMARRFGPARCLVFPARSSLIWKAASGFSAPVGVLEMRADGSVLPFKAGSEE